jgi:hypothetical protein
LRGHVAERYVSGQNCVDCTAEKARLWELENGRERHYRRHYGIGLDDYLAMEVAQGGCCAICDSHGRLNIDHCHASGEIRGLLCHNCNLAIGHMGDDSLRLRRAADYLEANEVPP